MSEPLGEIAGVKVRRRLIENKPYVELMIANTIFRMEPEACLELCRTLFEACTGKNLDKIQLLAMIGDTKVTKRNN